MDDDQSQAADETETDDQLQIRIPLKLDEAGRAVVEVRLATLERGSDAMELVVVDKLAHRTLDWTIKIDAIPGAATWSGQGITAPRIAGDVTTTLRTVLPDFYARRVGDFSTPPAVIPPALRPGAPGTIEMAGTPPGPGDPDGDL